MQRTPSMYEAEIAELRAERRQLQDALGVLRAERVSNYMEIDELKQWMSDACELLHDIRGVVASYHPPAGSWQIVDESVLALLRRAENP